MVIKLGKCNTTILICFLSDISFPPHITENKVSREKQAKNGIALSNIHIYLMLPKYVKTEGRLNKILIFR